MKTNFYRLTSGTSKKMGSTTNAQVEDEDGNEEDEDDDDDDDDDSSESDIGIHDWSNHEKQVDGGEENGIREGNAETGTSHGKNPIAQLKSYNESKKGLHRKQRGLMQWKPMRNLQFAKDEAKFAVRRTINKTKLQGRSPDVETEV